MSERKNLVGKQACSKDWDDTAILNSFETGIMSFRTKAQSKPAVATNNGSASPGADEPLSAAPVPQSQKRTSGANTEPVELKRPRAATNDTPTAALHAESGEKSKAIPQLPQLSGGGVNDEALQSMLMAWYYSGYATGRYQALKEVEEAAAAAAAALEVPGHSDSPEDDDGDKTRG